MNASNLQAADLLVEHGLVSTEQLAAARESAALLGEPVLTVLVRQGVVSKKEVVRSTVQAAGLEFVEIMDCPVGPGAVALLTGERARKYQVIPMAFESGAVIIAADSQTTMDWQVRDDLQAITRLPVRYFVGMKGEIERRLNLLYRAEVELGELVKDLMRSEEHTSELQSHHALVCRLLLEKKNTK